MRDEDTTFTILTEDGEEIECDILFTFDSEETGKSYVVYTDRSLDEKGNTQVYASIYTPGVENPRLQPIETEEEWNVIETVLAKLQEEIKNDMDDE